MLATLETRFKRLADAKPVKLVYAERHHFYNWARKHGYTITIRTLPDGLTAWRIL